MSVTAKLEHPANDPRRLGRLRFGLWSLFVLVGLAGVTFGWMGQRFDYAKRQADVARIVLRGVNRPGTSDNEVLYSYEFDSDGKWIKNAKPGCPEFLLRLVGRDFFYSIESLEVISTEFDDDVLQQIGSLSDLKWILLTSCDLTSDDLEHLRELRQIEYLDLCMNEIGSGGLKHLRNMTRLKHLELGYPKLKAKISDADLRHLSKLQELEYLGLVFQGSITDAGVESIARLKNLKRVALNKTQVTQEGAARLRRLLPDCTVYVGE